MGVRTDAMIRYNKENDEKPRSVVMTEISELDMLLNRLSKEELVRIVAEVCEQDPMLKNSLLLKYGEEKSDKRQVQTFK